MKPSLTQITPAERRWLQLLSEVRAGPQGTLGRTVRNLSDVRLYAAVTLAIAAAACAGHTGAAPAPAPAWSIPANGARAVGIDGDALIAQTGRMANRRAIAGIAVYDVATGKERWHRDGASPVPGTPLFFADGRTLERLDLRTGHISWRSPALCDRDGEGPSYVKVVKASVYAGCNGGTLFRLNLADGRVAASAHPFEVDAFQRIEMLAPGTLAVEGYASIGMYSRSAILNAKSLASIVPPGTLTPDMKILGFRGGEAIVADVCCRGTPDTNSPGAVLGVSRKNGDVLWSAAIHPYHPPLPLSDVEPGAGVFVLAGNRVYAGTNTALFVYGVEDLRARGSNAARREIYGDLRDRPIAYDGRYLAISEGSRAMVRRSALFDTATGREIWSDGRRPWSAPAIPQLHTSSVAELYSVTPAQRRFGLLRFSDGKMLPIDTGCYLQAASRRYAALLCGMRGTVPQLEVFDLDALASASAPPPAPSATPATEPPQAPTTAEPLLARWTAHDWGLIGSTSGTYFFGRHPNGIAAVDRKSGLVKWRNDTLCSAAGIARVIDGVLYAACPETVAILDRTSGAVLRKQNLGIYGFNDIVPAGKRAIVVEGWNDGAALSNDLAILDRSTLRPITDRQMTDSTFLGVIGDRAYIDDWCCFGRPDQYRPATMYSISLKDGSASKPVDLAPDPELHPVRMQPLGQGERNYLHGYDFYVVTPNYTYRYDVRDLNLPPVRRPA